jgi:hypothetical protein
MRMLLIGLLLLGSFSASPQTSATKVDDPLDIELRRIAGPSAIDCRIGKANAACAKRALESKQPFVFRIEGMQFHEYRSAIGYARNPSGDMYMLVYQTNPWSKEDLRKCRKGAKLINNNQILLEQCPKPAFLFIDANASTCFGPNHGDRPITPPTRRSNFEAGKGIGYFALELEIALLRSTRHAQE